MYWERYEIIKEWYVNQLKDWFYKDDKNKKSLVQHKHETPNLIDALGINYLKS